MFRLMVVVLLVVGCLARGSAAQEFKAVPISLSDHVVSGGTYEGIRLLGALQLPSTEINGLKLCGLSGLAWDEDSEVLYAISDRGGLFHLKPEFDDRGHLSNVRLIAGYPLTDQSANRLRHPYDDAEGLAILNGHNGIQGDTKLLVSFERKPRVIFYDSTGRWLGEEKIPALLRDVRNYRDSNNALEAITVAGRWGVLVGTEFPLRSEPAGRVRIYNGEGLSWLYPLSDAPLSALVAFEALPEGGLLTLERAFVAPMLPLIISLRLTEKLLPEVNALLKMKDVAVLDSSQGWLLDNFEGLSHYGDRRFFMVSDDNCNSLQETLLVQFELLPVSP